MQFCVGCALVYDVPAHSVFVFNVAVAQWPRQHIVDESLRVNPGLAPEELTDAEGGGRYTSIEVPAGRLSLHYEARVERLADPPRPGTSAPVAFGRIPPEVLPYLFSSRYCQADLLADFATTVTRGVPDGAAQVYAICDWVYRNLHYLPGTSESSTSALETARDRCGVCRDFAHLAITLCRARGIPARFVTGYAFGLPTPDFHACMEAHFAGSWHLFDPSGKVSTDRLIRIGTGRDAADASFVTIFSDGGPSTLTGMTVHAAPVSTEGGAER